MVDNGPILVTGTAGHLGAVGRTVTGLLLARGLPIRAMARREDDRAAGAEVTVADLLEPADVYRVVSGCRRVYFGMSASAGYLEAAVTMAAVAREVGVNALVNMSQMTVSQMSIQNTPPSRQQRSTGSANRRLRGPARRSSPSGQPCSWRGFSPSPVRRSGTEAASNCRSGGGKPSLVAAADVARVDAAVLTDPGSHLGRIYELKGSRSQDMHGVAREFSDALNREVTHCDIPPENWGELKKKELPENLAQHLLTMAELHRAGQ